MALEIRGRAHAYYGALPVTVRNVLQKSLALLAALLLCVLFGCSRKAGQLNVFILTGEKPGSKGEHDNARFLEDWKKLLAERGAHVEGAVDFPGREQLGKTDVLVFYSSDLPLSDEQKGAIEKFVKSGGGLVFIHEPLRGVESAWLKAIAGGNWGNGTNKPQVGVHGIYFDQSRHPVSEGVSDFEIDDEMFANVELSPKAKVIATSSAQGKEAAPQMWAVENGKHRAVVFLPGHYSSTFNLPHVRGLLLRGIAWAGRRKTGLLETPLELAHLHYPGGGPAPPQEAMKKLRVHSAFDLSLVAAEPLIARPVYVDWDAQGRMWTALTSDSPTNAQDAIVILEDSNADGRMDKKQLFAGQLSLLTSFVLHRDGVIVSQAPEILRLRDTDGDGVADNREVIFSGFSTQDGQGVINSFRWGPDGWIYGAQGETGGDSTNIVNGAGKPFGKIGNGIFRFKPDGSAIEMVSSFKGDTWGVDISWDGEVFFSRSKGPHIAHVMMPEKFLDRGRVPKATSEKTVEDHQKLFPMFVDQGHEAQAQPTATFTRASGCMLYQGGAWPMRYQYSHFVCEPAVHVVHEDLLAPLVEGNIGYEAIKAQQDEFIAGSDLWFRPVSTRYGPDGAMYVLDIYTRSLSEWIVRATERGAVDASGQADAGPRGRIWRIQHKHALKFAKPELAAAPGTNLVKALEHPNAWVRMTAQRELVERNETNVAKMLSTLVLSNRVPYIKIDALWTLYRLRALRETNLIAGLSDPHPSVQKTALRIITERGLPLSTNLEKVVLKDAKEADDRVKLNGLFALQQGGLSKETRQSILRHYAEQKDSWSKSAYLGVTMSAPMEFIKEALEFEKGEGLKDVVATLATHIADSGNLSNAVYLVQRIGAMVSSKKPGSSVLEAAVLDSFTRADRAKLTPKWTPKLEEAFKDLLDAQSSTVRYNALALANEWDKEHVLEEQSAKLRKQLLEKIHDLKKDEEKTRMISTVMAIPSIHKDVIPTLEKLFNTNTSSAVINHIVKEFGRSTEKEAASVLIRHYTNCNFEGKQLALGVLFKRTEWVSLLIDAIADKDAQLRDFGPNTVTRLINHPDEALAKRAAEVIESVGGPIARREAVIARFQPGLSAPADIKKGEEIFKRNCEICHKLGDKGKDLGPDLTGVGAHGVSVLLTRILDPNRTVEANYLAHNIRTARKEDLFGIIASETKELIKLRNVEGDTEIRLTDIVSRKSSGLSLMPEGFESLGEKAIRDVIAFVMEKSPKGYRTIELTGAFTADSRKGIYAQLEDRPTLDFKKFGLLTIDHIPFNIANPTALRDGKNLIVLKGGQGFARTLPQRVEIAVGTRAARIHVLGGIAGWGYPNGSTGTNDPLVKAEIIYGDEQTEELTFRNGYEFADYTKRIDVPGSRYVPDLTAEGQIRVFSFKPRRTNEIAKIVLQSTDRPAVPTFIAMTAQISEK